MTIKAARSVVEKLQALAEREEEHQEVVRGQLRLEVTMLATTPFDFREVVLQAVQTVDTMLNSRSIFVAAVIPTTITRSAASVLRAALESNGCFSGASARQLDKNQVTQLDLVARDATIVRTNITGYTRFLTNSQNNYPVALSSTPFHREGAAAARRGEFKQFLAACLAILQGGVNAGRRRGGDDCRMKTSGVRKESLGRGGSKIDAWRAVRRFNSTSLQARAKHSNNQPVGDHDGDLRGVEICS